MVKKLAFYLNMYNKYLFKASSYLIITCFYAMIKANSKLDNVKSSMKKIEEAH